MLESVDQSLFHNLLDFLRLHSYCFCCVAVCVLVFRCWSSKPHLIHYEPQSRSSTILTSLLFCLSSLVVVSAAVVCARSSFVEVRHTQEGHAITNPRQSSVVATSSFLLHSAKVRTASALAFNRILTCTSWPLSTAP